MLRKIFWLINYFKIKLNPAIECSGFVKIDNGVELNIEKSARLVIGRGVEIRKNAVLAVYRGATLTLGDQLFLAHGTTLAAKAKIAIGANTMIAEYVSIRDHDHNFGTASERLVERGDKISPVEIGQNVWIGAKATVIKGVKIGDEAVIGANAVVTKNIAKHSVAAGVPARVIHEKVL